MLLLKLHFQYSIAFQYECLAHYSHTYLSYTGFDNLNFTNLMELNREFRKHAFVSFRAWKIQSRSLRHLWDLVPRLGQVFQYKLYSSLSIKTQAPSHQSSIQSLTLRQYRSPSHVQNVWNSLYKRPHYCQKIPTIFSYYIIFRYLW